MSFGEVVRGAREKLGYSLRGFAEELGISPAYLSRVETESVDCQPSEGLILSMATRLDADADELLRLAGRIPSDIRDHILENPNVLRRLRKKVGRRR